MCGRWRPAQNGCGLELARDPLDDPPAEPAGQKAEPAPELRTRDPLQDLILVRVTPEDLGQVEDERDAVDRRRGP